MNLLRVLLLAIVMAAGASPAALARSDVRDQPLQVLGHEGLRALEADAAPVTAWRYETRFANGNVRSVRSAVREASDRGIELDVSPVSMADAMTHPTPQRSEPALVQRASYGTAEPRGLSRSSGELVAAVWTPAAGGRSSGDWRSQDDWAIPSIAPKADEESMPAVSSPRLLQAALRPAPQTRGEGDVRSPDSQARRKNARIGMTQPPSLEASLLLKASLAPGRRGGARPINRPAMSMLTAPQPAKPLGDHAPERSKNRLTEHTQPTKQAVPADLTLEMFVEGNGDGQRMPQEALFQPAALTVAQPSPARAHPDGEGYVARILGEGAYRMRVKPHSLPLGFGVLERGADVVTLSTERSTRAQIAVQVSGQIRGTLFLDANRDGEKSRGDAWLEGETVQLIEVETSTVIETQSAAFGHYAFEGLAPGRYRLRAMIGWQEVGGRVIDITPAQPHHLVPMKICSAVFDADAPGGKTIQLTQRRRDKRKGPADDISTGPSKG